MKKQCLILALILTVFTAKITAEDVKLDNFKWILQRKNPGSNTTDGKVINIELKNYQRACLQENIQLDKHKYIRFTARSNDNENHLIYIYIRRQKSPGNEASFYSLIELSPEWKTYYLRLERKHRSKMAHGYFAFNKGTKNCDIELENGGRLLYIQLAGKAPLTMQLKGIYLTSLKKDNRNNFKPIVERINSHPKFIPYRFENIIKSDAVPAKGFSIVIDKDSSESMMFAAEELAKYLKKATGADFPITKESQDDKTIRLSVKPSKPEEGFSAELKDGKNLTITGNSPRALVYAVYNFLEKAAGIRWLAPFDYGEVVPENSELKFPLFTDSSSPRFSYRVPHYCSNKKTPGLVPHLWKMADWAFKNRFNLEFPRFPASEEKKLSEFYKKRGGCIPQPEQSGHNFHKLIPPEKYFKTNPDFFCFDSATGKYRAERAQLCTTNPKLITELGKIADEYFKRNPKEEFFPLFQEDGSRLWCQCKACLALNPSGSNLASFSENNINLANLTCAEIQKRHPNKGVVTYSYAGGVKPTVNIKPLPDVRVSYCVSFTNPNALPWEMSSGSDLLEWSWLTKGNMMIYTYNYFNPRYPSNNETALLNTIRYADILTIRANIQETSEGWAGIDNFMLYQGARMAWNPWFDEKIFKDDYFSKLYGKASEQMQEVHNIISLSLSDKSKKLQCGYNSLKYFTETDLEKINSLLKAALNITKSDKRASKAVKAQVAYAGYLKKHSDFVSKLNSYYKNPDIKSYKIAKATADNLMKLFYTLISDRIISKYHDRAYKAWIQALDTSWESEKVYQKIQEKFNIVRKLNPWKFKTDPKAQGDKEKWFASDYNDTAWKNIKSGDFWEKQGYPTYDGAAWYRQNVSLPASQKQLGLYFGSADERAWIYLDGKYIGGHHEGDVGKLWNEPFTIMLPAGTRPGKHQLSVKVIDSAGGGGLWQDVFLIKQK
ncbi:MAG: DUF4838 domain-containing protein [Planctomycetota bacterium]|jgi:hypothetical protein